MNKTSLLLLIALCSSALGVNIQEHTHEKSHEHHHKSHERHHRSTQGKHHNHVLRHHHLKTRDGTSDGIFIPTNYTELIAIVKWLNNTNELKLLYQILPPSVKQDIFKNINANLANSSDNNANTTLFNGTTNVNLNSLYDSSAEYPILTYIAKLFGFFLSTFHGFREMCNFFPTFMNIWKIFLQGIMAGCQRTEFLMDNLLNLFGFNGTSGGNLFNFSSGVIHGFEHAIEGGLANLVNLTNFQKYV